ncbi:MAG: AAA-associated domain-containing protein, partial [Bacteroidota bacterium]
IITNAIIPDEVVPAVQTAVSRHVEPLPYASPGEILGLLEILDDHNGTIDIFDLAQKTGKDFGSTITVVKAAELLDFVDTPKHNVVFTDTGKQFLKGDVNNRKLLFKQQMLSLRLFEVVSGMLQRNASLNLDEEIVLEQLAILLPNEDVEKLFETMVGWARYGELFGYNADDKVLYLDTGQEAVG